jgi:nitric oxide reductase subunit B
VHFLMLIVTATVFAVGVALFIYDFFRYAPRLDAQEVTTAGAAGVAPSEP